MRQFSKYRRIIYDAEARQDSREPGESKAKVFFWINKMLEVRTRSSKQTEAESDDDNICTISFRASSSTSRFAYVL